MQTICMGSCLSKGDSVSMTVARRGLAAAVGLATIMVLAVGFHLSRGEVTHAVGPVILLALAVFVIYARGFKSSVTP